MLASDMNGIEGVVYIILVLAGFCLVGGLLAGPLAVVGTLKGGRRLRAAALGLAVTALFIGATGTLLVTATYLFLGSMLGAEAAGLLLLPPLASLVLGVVALRLRRKRKTSPAG